MIDFVEVPTFPHDSAYEGAIEIPWNHLKTPLLVLIDSNCGRSTHCRCLGVATVFAANAQSTYQCSTYILNSEVQIQGFNEIHKASHPSSDFNV